ncbi:MAG TPA: ABC transporter ATP-binding protein [Streptosporangiaceae bacterium]|nr:ABC transporter ATP-binding protein [Streptosporangiaceae bacterium]
MLPSDAVLDVSNLSVEFPTARGIVRAVTDVSFTIGRGEVLGLVGESGSGKSTVAHALVRVLQRSARCTGSVLFRGENVLSFPAARLRQYRWEGVSLVMQGAMNALNPVLTIESQVVDVIRTHRRVSRRAAKASVPELLELVGIDPARRGAYPHELSGGMRQRCVIAIALALQPDLVIMDEPTTALDVVVQRAIMDEIERLREQLGFSVLLISHDLDLVAERASKLAIMYAGRIVEVGPAKQVVASPRHPYTAALLASTMSVDGPVDRVGELAGRPPDLIGVQAGCAFFPRCAKARPGHDQRVPLLREVEPGHQVACHLYPEKEELLT